MRCLVLAKAMAKTGIECQFVCRDFNSNFSQRIFDAGFRLRLIDTLAEPLENNWLGVTQKQDVFDTASVLEEVMPDWFVIDHYAIDAKWEREVSNIFPNAKLMVLDDLANRKHDCDLLVDIGAGRSSDAYHGMVPERTMLLMGSRYALLSPEYARLREQMKSNDSTKLEDANILVSFGGGDVTHLVMSAVAALNELAENHDFTACFVGSDVPAIQQSVKFEADYLPYTNDMATLIANSDLVVGAAGGMSWERCCLGKPCVFVTAAENQIENAKVLAEAGAGIWAEPDKGSLQTGIIRLLIDNELRNEMGAKAGRLCDGYGAKRVLREFLAKSINLRRATIEDAQFIHEARYAGGASRYYKNSCIPKLSDHIRWLEKNLDDESKVFLVGHIGDHRIFHVRLDHRNLKSGEISIYLANSFRGLGLGVSALNMSHKYFFLNGINSITAQVHVTNISSKSVFERSGYKRIGRSSGDFILYQIQT